MPLSECCLKLSMIALVVLGLSCTQNVSLPLLPLQLPRRRPCRLCPLQSRQRRPHPRWRPRSPLPRLRLLFRPGKLLLSQLLCRSPLLRQHRVPRRVLRQSRLRPSRQSRLRPSRQRRYLPQCPRPHLRQPQPLFLSRHLLLPQHLRLLQRPPRLPNQRQHLLLPQHPGLTTTCSKERISRPT